MNFLAASHTDETIRMCSSAGGVFSLLAERILKDGGVVYGAAFDEKWQVVHRRVTSIKELDSLRRSKYVFSKIGTSLIDVIADLSAGRRVLFSGTPCQVAAIRKKAGNNPCLLCVEIFCHGAPRPRYWMSYLNKLCTKQKRTIADISSINFRDKNKGGGWKDYNFSICFKDGHEFSQSHDENLYMRAFLSNYLLRESCFDCKYKYPNGTCADITLGDFWGISQIAPDIDNNLGTTLVIARTSLGQSFLSEIQMEQIEIDLSIEMIARYNPALTTSSQRPIKHKDFEIATKKSDEIIRIMRKFAGRSLYEQLYIKAARFKYRILKR